MGRKRLQLRLPAGSSLGWVETMVPLAGLETRDAAPISPGDLLLRSGKVPAEAYERAGRIAAETGEPVETALTQLGLVSEREMTAAFSEACTSTLARRSVTTRTTRLPRPLTIAWRRSAVVLASA